MNIVEDPRNSPFPDYDNHMVNSITRRWNNLLNSKQFPYRRSGKVVVRFHLHATGAVSDVVVLHTDMDMLQGVVCEKAIQHSAPFGPWPPDMEKIVGKEYREITFTFYYYGK